MVFSRKHCTPADVRISTRLRRGCTPICNAATNLAKELAARRGAMKGLVLAVSGLVTVLVVALLVLRPPGNSNRSARAPFRQKKHRIAIIIPFVGEGVESIPPYLNLFCTAAAGSASLVDFLVIHNGVLDSYFHELPPNVKFISLASTDALADRLVRVTDHRSDSLKVESRDELAKIVTKHIHHYPYVLVEFKPALGHIFAEYITDYSHWGYADLDIAFGDLPRWITPDELTDYDIVTYGYGDQERVYLRGQFTFHKNTERVNQLWKGCHYLSEMDHRFDQVMKGNAKLRMESAEGCYSHVILENTDLRVKYAVKAFTDVHEDDTAHSHGIYVGIGTNHDRSIVYKAGSRANAKEMLHLSPTWFEKTDNVYGEKGAPPLQRDLGTKELVVMNKKVDAKCMYWVQEKYQSNLCVSGVKRTETLYWIDGKFYKQTFDNVKLPGNIVSSPFFHFQEWKRYYRSAQLASVHLSTDALGWVLAKEGAIPVFGSETRTSRWTSRLSPLGLNMAHWRGAQGVNREQLPRHWYCLSSGPRKFPPRPPTTQCYHSVCWQDPNLVEILHSPLRWKELEGTQAVTLSLTLQITAQQTANHEALVGIVDLAIANIRAWQGEPCVLVIHIAGAIPEALSLIRNRFGALELDACLVAMINQEGTDVVSRKALINMASDAAPTRWAVTGIEIERGMMLSKEAYLFTARKAKIHGDNVGNVLVLPQFAIDGHDVGQIFDFSIHDLLTMKKNRGNDIQMPSKFEGGCDDVEPIPNAVFEPVDKLWWKLTQAELSGRVLDNDDASLRELAFALDDIKLSFERLLLGKNNVKLGWLDYSPILMTDSIGPHRGVHTSILSRETEEFGGKQCFNGMRLAQLATLGYEINVVTGAFAASTRGTRQDAFGRVQDDALGWSRCDGCFMFDHKHESILEDIVNDERRRPAKALIVWNEANAEHTIS